MSKIDAQTAPFPQVVRRSALVRAGLTGGTIAGLIARQQLHPLRIGRGIYFDLEEVRLLIAAVRRVRENANPASPPPSPPSPPVQAA